MFNIEYEEKNNRAIAKDENKIIGECDYIENNNEWNIVHTIVEEEYQGKGIALLLVNCILEEAKKQNKKLIADCSYAKKVLSVYNK